jgi:hypothetical protein
VVSQEEYGKNETEAKGGSLTQTSRAEGQRRRTRSTEEEAESIPRVVFLCQREIEKEENHRYGRVSPHIHTALTMCTLVFFDRKRRNRHHNGSREEGRGRDCI